MKEKKEFFAGLIRGFRIVLTVIFILSLGIVMPAQAAGEPDLIINLSHTGDFPFYSVSNSTETYTISVMNSGGSPTDGTSITVVGTLPVGLSAVGIIGTGWACTLATLTCTRSDILNALGSYPDITLTVTVDNDAPNSVDNQASVSGGGEIDTSNNTDTDPTTIIKSDITITNVTLSPAEPNPNQAFNVNITVLNQGTSVTESLVFRHVYIDRNPSTFMDPLTGCPQEDGDYVRNDYNDGLPVGTSDTKSVPVDGLLFGGGVTTPGLPAGSHRIWVYVDTNCVNNESLETNNLYGPITVNIGGTFANGTAIVTSDQALAGTGRLHMDGQITAYNSDTVGDLNVSVPMLFKNQFGGDYDSALYIQNTHASNTANITINFYDVFGAFTCSVNDTIPALSSFSYWLPNVSCLPAVWSGGVNITSSQPISAVGRSHVGSQVTSYNDFASGSTTMYVPMLFKNQFGGEYDSALYVQNMSATDPAHLTIKFYDVFGVYSGEMSDTLTPLSATGYWIPNREFLPDPWSGGAVITSDQPIVAIGRPHIGDQVTAYNGFASGSTTVNVPMLFKNKPGTGGSYSSAIYVQNVDPLNPATVTTSFYDDDGTFRGSLAGVVLPSLSSTGFWLPLRDFLPDGWSGSAILTSDRPIVALGRLHVDNEIMTYNGSSGSASFYVPLLFEDEFNGLNYDSMLVLQNTQNSSATVTVKFYSNSGTLVCTKNQTVDPYASANFWLEDFICP